MAVLDQVKPQQKTAVSNEIWRQFRDEMPVARSWAYFDHGAVAPLSGPAQRALAHWLADATENGDALYPNWLAALAAARRSAATLVGAHTDEIALVPNTTAGIGYVAEGYPWQPGDNVVFPDNEFPSNQYPWLNLASRGVEIRRVPATGGRILPETLAAACDARTRIVSASWVAYSNGFRQDLDRLVEAVHARGALLFLDAIQGLGVFPIDVGQTPIDFLAADGHKWMLGPEGAGIFYIRRQHLGLLRPLAVGWNSVKHDRDFSRIEFNVKETGERYEGGSLNMAGFLGLGASLELLLSYGIERIGRRIVEISEVACDRLRSLGATIHTDRTPERATGIVSFEVPGRDPDALRKHCLQNKVVVSCRAGRLRISMHAYNNEADIDRLIGALAS